MGVTAVGDPGLGAAVLAGQETWGRDVNAVGLFRYSRHVQPRLAGTAGSQGARTDLKGDSPLWLRLTRRGETVKGEWSEDGKEWVRIYDTTLPNLPSSVVFGPLVAKQVAVEVTATLDEYEIELLPQNPKK